MKSPSGAWLLPVIVISASVCPLSMFLTAMVTPAGRPFAAGVIATATASSKPAARVAISFALAERSLPKTISAGSTRHAKPGAGADEAATKLLNDEGVQRMLLLRVLRTPPISAGMTTSASPMRAVPIIEMPCSEPAAKSGAA